MIEHMDYKVAVEFKFRQPSVVTKSESTLVLGAESEELAISSAISIIQGWMFGDDYTPELGTDADVYSTYEGGTEKVLEIETVEATEHSR